MGTFCGHFYRYRHQYSAIRNAKEKIQCGEVVIHIDYSEIDSTKFGKEIQATHYGHRNQVVIHQGVMYMKVNYSLEK